jgi:hypothetical protein
MAYQVDRFNGTFLTSVDDGTIDTTTDIRFVGKNYAGYGEVQNENFLHILENFSNTTPPPKVITGQVWYDSGTKKLKFYDGTRFRSASGAEVAPVQPVGLMAGDFWFDSSAGQLYVWAGTEFKLIGPEIAEDLSATAVQPQIVKDNLNENHPIVKFSSGSDVIAVISKDAFTLNSAVNPITGFSVIKKGINLVNTSGTTGVTSTDHFFWGTASNAQKLGGFDESEFVRYGEVVFDNTIEFKDPGFTVGTERDLLVEVQNGNEPFVISQSGEPITVRIRVSSSDQRDVAIFGTSGIAPGVTNAYNLGAPSQVWENVYATNFIGGFTGNLTGSTTGTHLGDIRANDNTLVFNASTRTFFGTIGAIGNAATVFGNLVGDVTGTATNAITLNSFAGNLGAVPSTVALRDSSSNITATRFIGISDKSDRLRINNSGTDDDPTYKWAKTTATPDTIAARTSSGDIAANEFQGVATSAKYADLAEKYLADQDYEVGTVVAVGGEKEVTASSAGDRAIGVVSANPAFKMNSELDNGTYIALKGRVPVKVIGKVKKGDRLTAADNGCAKATHECKDVFAVALESSDDDNVKLIESVIL